MDLVPDSEQVTNPVTTRLLVIASVERTGSTLLCSLLRGTRAAGTPVEYLNIQTHNFARFRQRYGVPQLRLRYRPIGWLRTRTGRFAWRNIAWFEPSSYRQYLSTIARVNTTDNGVFGIKMHWNQYKRHMLDRNLSVGFWNVPVTWVRITRQDEIRQAISFVRAAQTNSWNSNMEIKQDPVYDGSSIIEALERIASENADWKAYFEENNIQPLNITYEQLTKDMDATIRRVMDHIGIHIDEVPAPQTTQQSDSTNSEWATRFIHEFPQFAHRAQMPRP
ncbi:MAG: Stf0 family sulfotransferase [Ilumatobacteraceae bacterium]